MRFRAKLGVLGLGEAALALALWRRGPVDDPLRWSDPIGWLRATTVENALVEVGRIVVLALVGWMVLATALALAAGGIDRITGTTRCFAVVSRVVPGFVATMVAAALVTTAPVHAQPHRPVAPIGPVRDGRAPTSAVTAPTTTTATITTVTTTTATTQPVPATTPAPPSAAAPTSVATPAPALPVHVVTAGESLWSIARDRVGDNEAVLTPYWRALCDANRATLRSGDVNLIHPGEVIVVPEP